MPTKLARLRLFFDPEYEDLLIGLLYLHTPWGWQDEGLQDGQRLLTIHCDRPEQCAIIQTVLQEACPNLKTRMDSVEDVDWASAWKKYFTPIPIGTRFIVLPSWLAQEPQTAEPIIIEPKMAFGTGHHQTTALCLHALDDLAAQGVIHPQQSFLDLGTGSGILSIAAVKLGLKGLGLDIDPVAIDNALENAALNAIHAELSLEVGSIDHLDANQHFDLILANILANPLMDMAEDIVSHLARPGVLVLSGILTDQAQGVAEAYIALGLPEPEIAQAEEWARLVFRV
ncbi:MAG: 50S ribosomal protein L11 methyltransferase [Desulfomicrobium sp.]|nr:50S ribosomal protein L11 methyltransferase [Desulfomicrobium sp.]